MPRAPLILELGTGSALQSGSYTKAAVRAVQDALWHNSINLVELFGGEKSDMQIDVEIACQKPEKVDLNAVCGAFPYGQISAKSVKGGLDIAHPARPDGPPTIIAHAAIIVSLNLIKRMVLLKRLILEIGSGADLYGQNYTKAALRALDDALRHSSIVMFSALELNHSDMHVNVTIGVHEPTKVDVEEITKAVPRGLANVNIVFGGQNIDAREAGQPSVIATCAIEAFIPDMTEHFEIA